MEKALLIDRRENWRAESGWWESSYQFVKLPIGVIKAGVRRRSEPGARIVYCIFEIVD